MSQIRFMPENKAVNFTDEESVLKLALKQGVKLDHSCGGMGSCGTCRVIVESNVEELAVRNEVESEMAEARKFSKNERLACQICPVPGLILRIPS